MVSVGPSVERSADNTDKRDSVTPSPVSVYFVDDIGNSYPSKILAMVRQRRSECTPGSATCHDYSKTRSKSYIWPRVDARGLEP